MGICVYHVEVLELLCRHFFHPKQFDAHQRNTGRLLLCVDRRIIRLSIRRGLYRAAGRELLVKTGKNASTSGHLRNRLVRNKIRRFTTIPSLPATLLHVTETTVQINYYNNDAIE